MAFAVSAVARGGKIVVSGLMGGNFSLPMVQWVYKRMTIEGFMVGTLAEAKELMALARAGKIKPTPMKEEPMADVQKWIDELRAGKVVGRIVLKNCAKDHGRRSEPGRADSALQNGAAVAYDPSEPEIVRRILKETEGGFDGVVDFAGNEKSMAFAVATVARGGKIVVSGLMGGNFGLPMVQWVYKRMTIEGFMVGTLAEAKELMALARAGKIKPTPMKEEPMADVQKWIEELRAGKVVGRIVLKN